MSDQFELPGGIGDQGDYLGTVTLVVYEKNGIREFRRADGNLVAVNYCDRTDGRQMILHPGHKVQQELESWEGATEPRITTADYSVLVDWLVRRHGKPVVPANLFRHIRHNPPFEISDEYPSFVVLKGTVEVLREVPA